MNRLNRKQRIIIIVILIIGVISICYYAYGKNDSLAVDESLEIEEIAKEETNQEDNKHIIKVHVSGAVNNEGLIELEADSRVADAIEKAGGVTENACMKDVNLALVLEDGVKIRIPTMEEQATNDSVLEIQNIVDNKTSFVTNVKEKDKPAKVNINTANQTELESLPGIGASTALKIISYRKEKGRFKTIEDIKEVSGIGERKFNNLKELISV